MTKSELCRTASSGRLPYCFSIALVALAAIAMVSCKESAEPRTENASTAAAPSPTETTEATADQPVKEVQQTAGVHEEAASRIQSSRKENMKSQGAFDLEIKVQGQLDALRQQIIAAGGFTEGIVDGLRRLHEKYPTHGPTAALYARGLEKTQRWDAFADLLLEKPAEERTRSENIMLVDALSHDERYSDALEVVKPLLESDPDDLQLVRMAATAAFYANDYDRAAELLDSHWDALVADRRFEILYYRGVINIEQGNVEDGTRQLNELVTIVPDHSMAHEALGQVLIKFGEEESGRQHLEKARVLRESHTRPEKTEIRIAVLSRAAAVAWQQKDYDGCLGYIAELLPFVEGPGLVKLYQLRASVYQAQGRDGLAAESLAQAEEIRKAQDIGVSDE